MELLQQARAEIDAIDAQMAALFERRDAGCGQGGPEQGPDRKSCL